MLPGAEAFFQLFPYYELVLWNSDEATMVRLSFHTLQQLTCYKMGMESAEKLDPYHTAQRLFQEHITVREGKPFKVQYTQLYCYSKTSTESGHSGETKESSYCNWQEKGGMPQTP